MARHRTLITYLAAYFFAIATAIRYLSTFGGHPSLVLRPEIWTSASPGRS